VNLRFHPAVQRDINDVLDYYSKRSLTAADRFWGDLHTSFREIEENPHRFGFIREARGLRAVRLRKFPYLIVYYESSRGVKITCVKHEKRHPLLGMFRR
jgi:plasmid stabilization system protein ParE